MKNLNNNIIHFLFFKFIYYYIYYYRLLFFHSDILKSIFVFLYYNQFDNNKIYNFFKLFIF